MAEEYGKKDTVVTKTETVTTTPVRGDGAEAFVNDKKGPFPWWIPVALLLCALPLLYFMMRPKQAENNDAMPTTTRRPMAAPAAAPVVAAAPVTPAAPAEAPPVAPVDSAASATPPADTAAAAPASSDQVSGDSKVYSGKDIATGSTAAASSQGEPLSDVTQFTGATDRKALLGRKVKLTDAKVLRVITDRAFFVGASDQQQMLVLLDKGMDAGTGPQRVNIMPGGTVSLTGVVEAIPTPEMAQERYGLSSANYNDMGKQDAYLHATVAQKKDNLGK